jgi:hypothetical protein
VIVMVAAMTISPRPAPPRAAPPRIHTSCFSFRLDAEWARLRTDRRSLRHARGWVADDPAHPLATLVADATDLDVIIRATQRGVTPAGSDDVILHRLVELARDDELAGRVVIQRLLPGLISRACAHRDYFEIIDPIELVVPAAWLALRTFDTERRRRHIAPSLISDAVFAAFRAPLRRRSSSEEVRSPDRFEEDADALAPRSAMEELAELVRDARFAGVPTGDIELLRRLAQVESPSTVADERKVTSRTIRNHRDRAVERVRAALAIAA